MSKKNKTFYVRWIFGILFFISFLGYFKESFVSSLLSLILSFVLIPPIANYWSKEMQKRKNYKPLGKGGNIVLIIVLLFLFFSSLPKTEVNKKSEVGKTTKESKVAQVNKKAEPSLVVTSMSPAKPTSTPKPTPTQIPKDENGFPMDAQAINLSDLGKKPSLYNGKKIVFTCIVLNFAKNNNGDATAINCMDPNNSSSLAQVNIAVFDVTKINENDTVRVYGLGDGVGKGKNAFGGEVSEPLIVGMYINDFTSGYKE